MGNTRLVTAVQQQKILDGKNTVPKIFLINYGELQIEFDFFLDKWMKHDKADKNADIIFAFNGNIRELNIERLNNYLSVLENIKKNGQALKKCRTDVNWYM